MRNRVLKALTKKVIPVKKVKSTLNKIAHGTSTGVKQVFQSKEAKQIGKSVSKAAKYAYKQANKNENKKVYVPLAIKFAGNQAARAADTYQPGAGAVVNHLANHFADKAAKHYEHLSARDKMKAMQKKQQAQQAEHTQTTQSPHYP